MPTTRCGWDRVSVVDSLWGDGFIFLHGQQETLRLARPLVLSKGIKPAAGGCGDRRAALPHHLAARRLGHRLRGGPGTCARGDRPQRVEHGPGRSVG